MNHQEDLMNQAQQHAVNLLAGMATRHARQVEHAKYVLEFAPAGSPAWIEANASLAVHGAMMDTSCKLLHAIKKGDA